VLSKFQDDIICFIFREFLFSLGWVRIDLSMRFFTFFCLWGFFILGNAQLLSSQELRYQEPDRFYGAEVLKLQKKLLHAGFALGPEGVDGWFGPNTERALTAWQSRENQPTTGTYRPSALPLDLYWQPLFFYSRLEDVEIEDPLIVFTPPGGERVYTYFGVIEFLNRREKLEVDFWGSEQTITLRGTSVNASPNGRFLASRHLSEDQSYYHGLQIIDLLSEKEYFLSLAELPLPGELAERDQFQKLNILWTEQNNLAINPVMAFSLEKQKELLMEYQERQELDENAPEPSFESRNLGWYFLELYPRPQPYLGVQPFLFRESVDQGSLDALKSDQAWPMAG
jgi:peptidoglycan hydrolase-like protein with peptidoglycan-binding domain